MAEVLNVLAILLVLIAFPGVLAVVRGPTRADRLLASQVIGTVAIAATLVAGLAREQPFALDVALVLALLVLVASVTFVKRFRLPIVGKGDS